MGKSTVERLLTKRRNKNRHCQPKTELGGRGAPEQQEQVSVEKSQEKLQPSPGKDGSQAATLAKSPSMVAGGGAKHEGKDEEAKDDSRDGREGLFWRGHKDKQGGGEAARRS